MRNALVLAGAAVAVAVAEAVHRLAAVGAGEAGVGHNRCVLLATLEGIAPNSKGAVGTALGW